ncbi:hypothetical protein SK128_021884 [Halocaridina rubra]|uniref:alpha-glucosidase n=1 Tax=Halocaridina rubra TaxID=373956 RepID=A0AAN9A1I4_HALRR
MSCMASITYVVIALVSGVFVETAIAQSVPFFHDTVIYQVYPRSFYDGIPDGTGDLKGVASKVDYLKELGIGAVWFSPIFSSPMADFGYDISNFTEIDPIFGTMQDFDDLLVTLHANDMKVIMDLVPNHSSDEHEWFQKSIQMIDPYTDYYVWADPLGFNATGDPIYPNNWVNAFRGHAWTWVEERQQFYLHQFLTKQPDLNYRFPPVVEEMRNVLRFWLDKGVDGFRVDAFDHLVEVEDVYQDEPVAIDSGIDDPLDYGYLNHTLTMNQPGTYLVLRELRLVVDEYQDKLLMVEAGGMEYYGNETFPLAHFPFNFLIIGILHNRTDFTGNNIKYAIDQWMDNMPEGMWPNWVLGNHDNRRVGSRIGADLVDCLNMLMLLLPGTPINYYGEEIGMLDTWISWEDTQDPQGCNYGPDGYEAKSRDPERTPMQWDDTNFAGFTTYNDTWLPVNENYITLNVKAQQESEFSHLKVYQNLTRLRQEPAFRSMNAAYPVITELIFSVLRYAQNEEMYLLVINTSEEPVVVNLHHSASFQLPDTGVVVLRSASDTSVETSPGSVVSLDSVPLVGGEGIVFSLGLSSTDLA